MDRILIILKIPSLGEKYDVYVPTGLQINRLIPLLAESIKEISNGRYAVSSEELLCYEERNIVLDLNSTLGIQGVKNGDSLILL